MTRPTTSDTILVTGFEPFDHSDVNPSGKLTELLDGTRIGDSRIVSAVLPVSRLGSSAGLTAALERVAINVLDYPMPDNEGGQPTEGPIEEDGPAAYFTTLPIKAILASWQDARVPGYISNTAGTFLCNQIMYQSLHLATRRGYGAGFIHVPDLPEQVERGDALPPSLEP